MKKFKNLAHTFFSNLVRTCLVISIISTSTGAFVNVAANAALADCGTAKSPNNTAQNSLTVTPSHGAAFYIDSAASQQMDAQYIAYRISSSVNYQSLWVSVDNFSTGSVISIVNPADSPYPIDSIVGGDATPTTVYFLLKASMSSNSPQKHDFKIYQGKPSGQTPLYACTFTFTKVRETIKANPNKVDSVAISNSTPNIGGTFQVSVLGNTGTIGAGSSPDNDSIWLSPVPQSSWPSRAIRLEKVELLLDNNNTSANDTCGSGNSCYTNQLIVNNLRTVATTLGNSNTSKLYYLAKYTFRVIGRASQFTFKPIAQISSGTQMKHSPISSTGAGTATIDLSTVDTKLIISQKAITSPTATNLTTRVIGGTTYMGVDYKVTVQNTGTTTAKIDGVLDTPDPALLIDSTTATTLKTFTTLTGGTGTSITPAPTVPSAINGTYTFTTPVTISASGRAELTYRMLVPQCSSGTKTYVNYVVAKIGGTSFGSASAGFAPDASLQFSCGTNQLTTTSSGSGSRIPFEVSTNPASSISNTSATLNGVINSFGVSGKAITFEYWSNSNSVTTVTSTPGTTTTSTDVLPVSYSLTGLTQGTKYYFRVISDGINGATLNFVTTEPVSAPTVVTDPPTSVSSTDAILNGTVDPNQTPVYFAYDVYTSSLGSASSPYEYRIFDDLTASYNATTNPLTQFSGSFPVQVPINMNTATLISQSGSKSLDSLIKANDTVYYRAKAIYVSGGTVVTGSWQNFKMTTYLNQTISWNSISDIQWGASAPTLSPTSTSGMTVTISLDPTSTGCTYAGNVLTITQVGTCTLLADQNGGLKSGTSNYYNAAEQVPITFNILANEVTVTAEAKSKFYGDSDPLLSYTTNFTVGSLKSGDAFTGSLTRAAGGTPGTYAISQGTLTLGSNYIITFVGANLTINARPVTVTATPATKIYGNSDPASFVYTITSGSLVGSDAFTGALSRASGENATTYAINQGNLALNTNYALTYVSADFTITKRPITFKANSFTRSTSGSDPTFTYSITSGSLAFSDTASPVLTRVSGSTAGTYAITISNPVSISPSAANYDVTLLAGTLTITDKTIPNLVWANPTAITYGETLTAGVQLNAVLKDASNNNVSATCTYSPAAGTTLEAGTHTLSTTCVPDSATFETVSGTVTIVVNPKALTVTADAKNKVYGATDPGLTYVTTCLVSPCLVGSDAFTGNLSRTTESDGTEKAIQYDINIGSLTLNSNYTITYVSAKLTVAKKSLTIAVTASNKEYDGNSSATVQVGSLSGVLNSDIANVSFSGSVTGAFTDEIAGNGKTVTLTYTKTLSGSASGNYSLDDPVNPTANITKKPLQITAADKTVAAGNALGSISYTVNSGDLVGSDTSSVVSGVTCTSDYLITDSAGTSRSTTCSGGTATNYLLSYTSGVVTIIAATTYTITFDINGGTSGSTASQTGNGSIFLNKNGFSRSGYNFLGWSSSNSGNKEFEDEGAYNLTANVTLFAVWQLATNSNSPGPIYVPNPPTITSISSPEVCAVGGQLLIRGTNLNGATATIDGVAAKIVSSSMNEMSLSLPTAMAGTRTLRITNADGSASTTVKYTFVDIPVYVNYTYPILYKDFEFGYTFSATDAAKYAIQGRLPAGLSINSLTGEISGTPTVDGEFTFTIVASNVCGNAYLNVSMFVDKAIPEALTCTVLFNIPNSDLISPSKMTALRNCMDKVLKLSPNSLDPVIFLSGGVPPGLTQDELINHPRYSAICELLNSMGVIAQIIVGAFDGELDQVQVMLYWPEPLDV